MTSLKAFTPKLAGPLSIEPVALYERQRVLFGANMLISSPGRGPGSGVRLTSKNLALLVISVMATDALSDVADAARSRAILQHVKGKCPVTGAKSLVDAIASVFSSKELSRKVGDLILERELYRATLFFSGAKGDVGETFRDLKRKHPINGLLTSVRLPQRNLIKISDEFQKLSDVK